MSVALIGEKNQVILESIILYITDHLTIESNQSCRKMLPASSCEIASGGGFKNVKIKLSVGDHKWGRWGKKSGNFGITLSTYSHGASTHATSK